MSEGLIYSVDRVPERTFDTSRAVQVITADDIRRMNAAGLADLLVEQAGVVVASTHSGGIPGIRGLSGKQVMILIDGVKVNNASWGGSTREYLDIIDLHQVDRIEIVRGVVSVLGTESLGGVINIITKKGTAAQGKAIGGSISARYATADSSLATPVEVFGEAGNVRYNAGVSQADFDDLRGGGNVGRQAFSSFEERSGFLNGQWLLTPEKTIGFGYQNVEQREIKGPSTNVQFTSLDFTPRYFQLANVSYQDLTSRGWEETLRVTAYWNRQGQKEAVFSIRPDVFFQDSNVMQGLNIELGSFVKRHHLVYGVDLSSDEARSAQWTTDAVTHATIYKRGNVLDGAKYQTLGIYLQDRFDVAQWLTVVAGARYGQFRTKGVEHADLGIIDLNSEKGDVTGALNLIGHVTPRLNVIANAFRGFRAPNVDDTSHYNFVPVPGGVAFQVPTPGAEPERVVSYEGGLKYDDGHFSGSAFYFHNKLSNLLTIAPGLFNGLPYRDSNGNGVREPNEFSIVQNQNVGSATIKGFELEGRFSMSNGVTAWGHFSHAEGTDTRLSAPLSGMPPAFGTLGLRYASATRFRPWAEVVYRYYGSQDKLGAGDLANPDLRGGSLPGFDVVHLRTGMAITERILVTAALENIFDEKYREIGSAVFAPRRQLVIGSQFRF